MNVSKPEYRLISVTPVGKTGTDVKVSYYSTSDGKLYEKLDKHKHITPTIELNLEKYGYTKESILAVLESKYPDETFKIFSYGKKFREPTSAISSDSINDEILDFNDSPIFDVTNSENLFTEGSNNYIIWHIGNREMRKNLEFYIDKDNRKQIFICNNEKRFLARTRLLPEDKLKLCIEHFRSVNGSESIVDEDIQPLLNNEFGTGYLQVRCNRKQLYLLPELYFRVLEYRSEYFKDERSAEKFSDSINLLPQSEIHLDRSRVIELLDDTGKKVYFASILTDYNTEMINGLLKAGMVPHIDYSNSKDKHIRSVRELLWDPIDLGSPSKQLRDFYPLHNAFNPTMDLESQANTDTKIFTTDIKSKFSLESAVDDAIKYYTKNSCAIDIEVIDFVKGKIPSGRIFMAVLQSNSENNLYLTKEVWNNNDIASTLIHKYASDAQIVAVEDDIALIDRLCIDSKNYSMIIGHNFRDFDTVNLSKYNSLHNIRNIDSENNPIRVSDSTILLSSAYSDMVISRIKNLIKIDGRKRLWDRIDADIFDTLGYVKPRVDIYSDQKLATLSGFKKSLGYDEITRLIREGTFEGLCKVIDYTLIDGVESWKVSQKLLRNAILESIAVNKPLSAISSTNPVKNFYDHGRRKYFMTLKTYMDRHEMSHKRKIEKLDSRMDNNEILSQIISESYPNIRQTYGKIKGNLQYPSLFIESFKDILFNNPACKLIYKIAMDEKDPLLKADLLWKLSSALLVPVDKSKKYLESRGFKLGELVMPSQYYAGLDRAIFLGLADRIMVDGSSTAQPMMLGSELNPLHASNISGIMSLLDVYYDKDFENSRTSFIFGLEYARKISSIDIVGMKFDNTILKFNNILHDKLEKFVEGGFTAKSKSFYISKNDIGYKFGDVHAINFKSDSMLASLNGRGLFLNTNPPKDSDLSKLVNNWVESLDGDLDEENKINLSRIVSSKVESDKHFLTAKNKELVESILGISMRGKSKGTLPIF